MEKTNLLRYLLPSKDNHLLVYSELRDCHYSKNSFPAVGIKYVVEGEENYYVDGKEYIVGKGQFVLVNPGQEFECDILSRTPAIGICMNVGEALIRQAEAALNSKPELLLDDPSRACDHSFPIINIVQEAGHSRVCRQLVCLQKKIAMCNDPFVSGEIFYSFAEDIVKEHYTIERLASRLVCKRKTVRDELFRRIETARRFIESSYLESLSIKVIAEKILLSEYYFLHNYKRVYGITPHQHIITKRMQFAAELLKQGNQSIDEIATVAGYPDVYSFSKSFKKQYHTAPSAFRKKIHLDTPCMAQPGVSLNSIKPCLLDGNSNF